MAHTTNLADRNYSGHLRNNVATITLTAYTSGAGGEAISSGELGISSNGLIFLAANVTVGDYGARWNGSASAPRLYLYNLSDGAEATTGAVTCTVKVFAVGK